MLNSIFGFADIMSQIIPPSKPTRLYSRPEECDDGDPGWDYDEEQEIITWWEWKYNYKTIAKDDY